MQIWRLRPQEQSGNYQFSGTFYVTRAVHESLSQSEILTIYKEIQRLVKENGGLDYFQVFENEAGDKLYFIDQLEPEMMDDNSFPKEENYCTLLFSNEY